MIKLGKIMSRKKRKYQRVEYYSLSPEAKKGLAIIILFVLAVVSLLSFLNLAGQAGIYVDRGFGIAFGWGRYIIPLILIFLGYVLARPQRYEIRIPNYIGVGLFILSLLGLLQIKLLAINAYALSLNGLGGGLIGYFVNYPLNLYLGFWASLIILLGIFIISLVLTFNTSLETLFRKTNIFRLFQPLFKKGGEEEEEATEETEEEEETEEPETEEVKEVKFAPTKLLREKKVEAPKIKVPKIKTDLPLNLLENRVTKPTSGDIKLGAERIKRTLENFNIDVEMGDVQVGPTVTQYTLKPAEGVKLSRITALSNDLALALAAHPIRIEAPIPGKSLVGVEVPNQKPAIVRVRETLESVAFKKRKNNLQIALGKDVSGLCWLAGLGSMPHLLVAGATGSGKSVCLNSVIISLLYQNNPDTLRFILIDPKRVEFPIYNGLPHLLTPVITDVTKTIYALRWSIAEMERRFDVLAQSNKRNIDSYNAANTEKMPYIVIIIDELADLMVMAPAEVEGCIIRLTQMARAVGIHIIVATQRPSVDVITGLIKANIPCRIAFSVASLIDSRTILDTSGAEKLMGKGDMLFINQELSKPRRLQGAYVGDEEIKRVVTFLRNACEEPPEYNEEIISKPNGASINGSGFSGDNEDELFNEAKHLVAQAGKASASLLQRRLRVGYARAARLIDLLEEAGIVGPADGARPREIIVDKESLMSASRHSLSALKENNLTEEDEATVFQEELNEEAEEKNEEEEMEKNNNRATSEEETEEREEAEEENEEELNEEKPASEKIEEIEAEEADYLEPKTTEKTRRSESTDKTDNEIY